MKYFGLPIVLAPINWKFVTIIFEIRKTYYWKLTETINKNDQRIISTCKHTKPFFLGPCLSKIIKTSLTLNDLYVVTCMNHNRFSDSHCVYTSMQDAHAGMSSHTHSGCDTRIAWDAYAKKY